MTAREFVAAIRKAGRWPADPANAAACKAWRAVKRRPKPAFDHPPDPVLDLLAKFDLAGVAFWQLAFASTMGEPWDGAWPVATKATSDYYVKDGQLQSMYYKAAHPQENGLTSAEFLDLVALYAEMIAGTPAGQAMVWFQAAQAGYAARAAAISPHAANLDWFGESRARNHGGVRPVFFSAQLCTPGTLSRAVAGSLIAEPTPDVDPDPAILALLRRVAGRLVTRWTRSVRRFDETSVWGRGEFGSEDVLDGGAKVGTTDQHVEITWHYSEPEQEMFPTARHERRKYVVRGLPEDRLLAVWLYREWRAGTLERAILDVNAMAPMPCHAKLGELFRESFEARG